MFNQITDGETTKPKRCFDVSWTDDDDCVSWRLQTFCKSWRFSVKHSSQTFLSRFRLAVAAAPLAPALTGISLRWITSWHCVLLGCRSQCNLDRSLICQSNPNPIWLIWLFTPRRRTHVINLDNTKEDSVFWRVRVSVTLQGELWLRSSQSGDRPELTGYDFPSLQHTLITTKHQSQSGYQVSKIWFLNSAKWGGIIFNFLYKISYF